MIKRLVPMALLGLLMVGIAAVAAIAGYWYYVEADPRQPIAYNHSLHIKTVGLECDHCHRYASRSIHAGIPAMSICLECHEDVAVEHPEVKKLLDYWQRKEPVPWRKVHVSEWHVRFTHKRHVNAGVACDVCHGLLSQMTVARKVRTFHMGFCVNCHRENKASDDCLVCHK